MHTGHQADIDLAERPYFVTQQLRPVVAAPTEVRIPALLPEAEKTSRMMFAVLREIGKFAEAEQSSDERLGTLQYISQLAYYLSEESLRALAEQSLGDDDHRIRGEMCYMLGRSGNPLFALKLYRMLHDPHRWVRSQAEEALNVLKEQVNDESLQVHIGSALTSPDSEIRAVACDLLEAWSKANRQRAAQFEAQLRRLSTDDSDEEAEKRATELLEKLAIIAGSRIDLELFAVADVYRKMQVLRYVWEHPSEFGLNSKKELIEYALHDPEPEIRGIASQMVGDWARLDPSKWLQLEPRLRSMVFDDASDWVSKQASPAARTLYWLALWNRQRKFIVPYGMLALLLCLAALLAPEWFSEPVALSVLGRMFSGPIMVAAPWCDEPYVRNVTRAYGTQNGDRAIGIPDGRYARVGSEANSELVLDMGIGNSIVDNSGVDFYLYEHPNAPGILLDHIQVSVARDNGMGEPEGFRVVFVWGDGESTNNGFVPAKYWEDGEEEPNEPIKSGDLYNGTGIGIDIGGNDGAEYRFVLIQTYPAGIKVDDGELQPEVDAIERVCPPPVPTSIPSPTVTSVPTVSSLELSPVLICVDQNLEGMYTAHFGYDNSGAGSVTVPVGPDNRFSPGEEYRGQPTEFEPGLHHDVFTVAFLEESLVWTLTGHAVTASRDSDRCVPTATPTTEQPTQTVTPEASVTPKPTATHMPEEPTATITPEEPTATVTPEEPTATHTPSLIPTTTSLPPTSTDTPVPVSKTPTASPTPPEPTPTPVPTGTSVSTSRPPAPTRTPVSTSPPPALTDTPVVVPTTPSEPSLTPFERVSTPVPTRTLTPTLPDTSTPVSASSTPTPTETIGLTEMPTLSTSDTPTITPKGTQTQAPPPSATPETGDSSSYDKDGEEPVSPLMLMLLIVGVGAIIGGLIAFGSPAALGWERLVRRINKLHRAQEMESPLDMRRTLLASARRNLPRSESERLTKQDRADVLEWLLARKEQEAGEETDQ